MIIPFISKVGESPDRLDACQRHIDPTVYRCGWVCTAEVEILKFRRGAERLSDHKISLAHGLKMAIRKGNLTRGLKR
jgi:hypothetical protein